MPDPLEADVIVAEERLRLAVLFSDVRALDELLSDDLRFTDQTGHVASKADDLAFHRSGALRLVDLSPTDQHIQLLPSGAVVSVLMHFLGSRHGQPLNQLLRFTRVWAAGPDGALRLLAGQATELRPASAPEAPPEPPAEGRGLGVTGRVMWAALPVPGARLELKTDGNYYELPALAEAVTGADGWFVLENPPAGKFTLYAVAPSEEFWGWSGHSITIAAGQAVRSAGFELSKKMELLEPAVGATLDTPSPLLSWEPFPEATRYHVDVFNDMTGEAVMRADTTDTSLVVTPPLARGGRYQWSVHASNFAHQQIAYYSSWLFMIKP